MEVTRRNLVLTFVTPARTEETITITNPADMLTGTEIKKAMTDALASGVIGENLPANGIGEAKYVIQQVDTIDLDEA